MTINELQQIVNNTAFDYDIRIKADTEILRRGKRVGVIDERIHERPFEKTRNKIYIALEEVDMIWDTDEVEDFRRLWRQGKTILEISRFFKRDPDEIALLIMDQAQKGLIKNDKEPDQKGSTKQVTATIEKMKNDVPTAISIGGRRYVLEAEGGNNKERANKKRQRPFKQPKIYWQAPSV
ncbi:hypothetical protein BCV73_08750 [Paenibacillus sp. SSG-1]|nr:hypothetical protein BCV73_08750 [Paenibacillus sp. SSG-1]